MALLTADQRSLVRRALRRTEPKTEQGELNVIPFLDIVMNVVMFLLAGLVTVFTAQIPVPAPHNGQGETPPPVFTVNIVPEGYVIATDQGYMQPGCARVGPAAVAVPSRLGEYDAAALTSCLLAAHMQPRWQNVGGRDREIHVASTGAVPYAVLVRTLDAVRESRPGARDLFARPTLGILN